MSDQILQDILEKLNQMENRMANMEIELKSIKADTVDIPLIRQAVLETHQDVK